MMMKLKEKQDFGDRIEHTYEGDTVEELNYYQADKVCQIEQKQLLILMENLK